MSWSFSAVSATYFLCFFSASDAVKWYFSCHAEGIAVFCWSGVKLTSLLRLKHSTSVPWWKMLFMKQLQNEFCQSGILHWNVLYMARTVCVLCAAGRHIWEPKDNNEIKLNHKRVIALKAICSLRFSLCLRERYVSPFLCEKFTTKNILRYTNCLILQLFYNC